MNETNYNQSLFSFFKSSPTPFHAVSTMKQQLSAKGYSELYESDIWQLEKGKPYFITREQGAIIAFVLGEQEDITQGFRMACAHTDSPCLQIKPKPDIKSGSLQQLGVELYGGALVAPWFDRDLSIAGRINCLSPDGAIITLLIDFARPLLTIPSIAIHLEREANKKPQINNQKHLLPIFGQEIEDQLPSFKATLSEQIKKEYPTLHIEDILSYDIFCNDFQGPSYLGGDEQFIASGKLDNLLSCHAGMTVMQELNLENNCILFCANHEENGSTSTSGAQGAFLDSLFDRIIENDQDRRIAMSNSFLISMDNAHATHPNYPEKMDTNHTIELNKGPVIKINANQRYATSSTSSAIYKAICKKAGLTPQEFVMRNDMPCGSTIGPLTAARLGVRTIDIGAASLAMHSIRELTGRMDPYLLHQSIHTFMASNIHTQLKTL